MSGLPVLLRVYDYYPRMDLTDPKMSEYLGGAKAVTMGFTDYIDFGLCGVQGCYRAYGGISLKVVS